MARTDTGKLVGRAAATGGSRTYRGQRPLKWYASLVLIVVVGVGLVWYSRYERQNPVAVGHPTTSDHYVAALQFDICSSSQSNMTSLPASPVSQGNPGLTTAGNGILNITPHSSSEAGSNATLAKFASEYKGLVLTTSSIRLPGKGSPTLGHTFYNGNACPPGTPDAGKRGQVSIALFPNFTSSKPIIYHDPAAVHFSNTGEMVVVGFVPAKTTLPKPPGTVVTALLNAVNSANGASSTPSSIPPVSLPSGPSGSGTIPTAPSGTSASSSGTSPTAPTSSGAASSGAASSG